ncbi:SMAD/FHA [Glarea lozoyensis ATCC 20868]|uniref:SMAD/FHA n=1 Tax=Glarea lozoyensis (strain ATCC 20868 / MF5171) TaxID=1116229 RepID=S3DDV7_GLAL2|nr:SMAD/FHA [Glarea lozoyensis ATCC 20868]EPE35935.1 SMAD/FHA [Glarea lozoyensis ATCC 20868]
MPQQVTVTLRSLVGDFDQRRFILTPDSPVIVIGRASKSIAKNILGAVDNAWFDSPVMSRSHAKLKFDDQKAALLIQDIGSMHGTCVNGTRLESSPVRVHHGDVLVLGAEVKRGPEVFPACEFEVGIELSGYSRGKTFCFPEMDDSSSECEISDESTDEHQQVSSESNISIESPQQTYKAFHSTDAIDLTGDDSPAPSPILGTIDLTGEPALIAEGTASAEVTPATPSHPIEFSDSDHDDEMDDLEDSENSDISDSVDSDESHSLSDMDDRLSDESGSDDDRSLDNLSNSSPLTNVHAFDMAEDDDDDSDFGLSDAGEEGLRVLFDNIDAMSNTSPECSSPVAAFKSPFVAEDAMINSEKTVNIFKPAGVIGFEPSSFLPHALSHLETPAIGNQPLTRDLQSPVIGVPSTKRLAEPVVAIDRQPSPSDAAMVKTAQVKQVEQAELDSVQLSTMITQSSENRQLAQTLADKTGKHAFFEAREKNKAKINEAAENIPKPFMHEFSTPNVPTRTCMKFAGKKPFVRDPNMVESSYTSASSFNYIPDFPSPNIFKCNVPTIGSEGMGFPAVERAASPEYDMTSAVTFNESKAKAIRSRLSIHDIIENPPSKESIPPVEARTGEKRKASEISDIQEEVRAWATSPETAVVETPSTTQIQSQPHAREGRPMKKLKTLMNRAAYVAAGGAAIFFGLVATAPDFA